MIQVWRIGYCPSPAPAPAALMALLGFGSTLANGRWHTMGPHQMVYAGSSRALCQLEKRVHANGSSPKDQALVRLEIPDSELLLDVRTQGFRPELLAIERATQSIGDQWLASGSSLGLWVPSFVEPSENNLLLNPAHPGFAHVQLHIERHPFVFDPRLF